MRVLFNKVSIGLLRCVRHTYNSAARRSVFTEAQAASALRPFYFAVHPDLFTQHPQMQEINEESLKQFNGYLNTLISAQKNSTRFPSEAVLLKFYLRNSKNGESTVRPTFRSVNVVLNHSSVYALLLDVLNACELPTKGVHEMGPQPSVPDAKLPTNEEILEMIREIRRKHHDIRVKAETVRPQTLIDHIQQLRPLASKRLETHDRQLADCQPIIDELIEHTGLASVSWDNDWASAQFKACLLSLRRILFVEECLEDDEDMVNFAHPFLSDVGRIVRGLSIRFSPRGTYVDVLRQVNLGVDDVPEDWMRVLKSTVATDAYSVKAQRLSRELQRLLGGATIETDDSRSLRQYAFWLKMLRNNLINYLHANHLSANGSVLPGMVTSGVTVIIGDDHSTLRLAQDGVFHVPSNVQPLKLVQFMKSNVSVAKSRCVRQKRIQDELETTLRECEQQVGARSITIATGMDPQEALDCLYRLEQHFGTLPTAQQHQLQHMNVHIARTYHVLPNGTLVIPANWLAA